MGDGHALSILQHGYTKTGACACGQRLGPVPGDRVDQLIREYSIHIGIYRKPLKETSK